MPLIMPDEQFPAKPVIVMIVGTPGSYKTSLSTTSKNAIHIDGDGGGQRAIRNCPVLSVKSWSEIRVEDENGIFKGKNTCIFDTPKSLLDDFLWDWCQQQKFNADDRKVYGAISKELKSFSKKRELEGMDLVFISHEKSAERKDKVVYEPDITGGTKQLLLRMADQIGFIEKREIRNATGQNTIQTVLTFNSTPEWPFCKNTAQLEDIVLPHYSSPEWKTILNDRVIQPLKDMMASQSEAHLETLNVISDWRVSIDALEGDDDVVLAKEITETYGEVAKLTPEHIKKQITSYFLAHLKKIGWKWDKPSNAFVNTKGAVKDETTPPAETTVNEPVASDSNPAALTAPKEDLFDPEVK